MQHLQNTKPQETSESGEVIVLPPLQVRRRAPAFTRRMNDFLQRVIPALLGLGLLVVLWQLAAINSKGFPTPLSTLDSAMTLFADPFYRDGPNDMGIGWNVLASLQRVAIGFGLAAMIAALFLSFYLLAPSLGDAGPLGERLIEARTSIDDTRARLRASLFGGE